jgi:hypothetical protein
MTDGTARGSSPRTSRHERPAIDEAGLVAARHADRLIAEARDRGLSRWVMFFETLPDRLRDEEPGALRSTAMRSRAAFGARDSVRDALPAELTEPFLDSIDRLLRELNRELHRARG